LETGASHPSSQVMTLLGLNSQSYKKMKNALLRQEALVTAIAVGRAHWAGGPTAFAHKIKTEKTFLKMFV